jgi:hypothetical protein
MLWIFQQLWPNLLSEALGIVVTVLIINTLLQRRERKRWAPARLIIARYLARTYATGSSACFQIVAGVIQPSNNPLMTPQRRATESLQRFAAELQRMHHIIDINNVALDATNMSDVAEFLDAADELVKRLAFLAAIHLPANTAVDFICDSPVDLIRRMHAKADKFRRLYPSSWDNSLIFSSAKTPDDMSTAYESAKYPKMPLFLSPEAYQHTQGRMPLVPDLEHLRRVKTTTLPLGVSISVASS